jgi:ribosomal protein S18 acetylase RimI-like enzyme
MEKGTEIIRVKEAELPVLVQLSRETFFKTYFAYNTPEDMQTYLDTHFNTAQLASEIIHPDSEYYFIRINENHAGYVKLNFGEAQGEMQGSKACEIQRLYILEKYQGLQLGKTLVEFTKSRAIELGLHFVWLGVWQENKRAIEFYLQNGFEIVGTHDFLFGEDVQSDWIMKLHC